MADLPVGCHYCRTTKYPWSWYVTRSGERVRLCDERTACLRRKMKRDGIKLLPAHNTGRTPDVTDQESRPK